MNEKDNPLQTVEHSTEQNMNMIDGIINNTSPQLPPAGGQADRQGTGATQPPPLPGA